MNAHSMSWRFLSFPSSRAGLLRALFKLRTADALIKFGGPAPHAILRSVARAFKIPIFVIWAGSDVTLAADHPNKIPQAQRTESTHLVVAPWLADELKRAGFKAQYIPVIGVKPNVGAAIPRDEFSILSYLPEPRRDFYGRAHVYDVARRMPEATFMIVGSGSPDPSAPPNVRFFGWLSDITPILDRCSVLLRVPDHDGMSLVVLEALARGRFVAWKYGLPGVTKVATPNDTLNYLTEVRARLAADPQAYNSAGMEFVASKYDEQNVARGVESFLTEQIRKKKQIQVGSRQVVISGLDIFATDLSELNNRLQTGWTSQVLQFETRYEMVGSLLNLARADVLHTVGTPILGRAMGLVASVLRKPRVMHWVGSDIAVARRNSRVAKNVRRPYITHLT